MNFKNYASVKLSSTFQILANLCVKWLICLYISIFRLSRYEMDGTRYT